MKFLNQYTKSFQIIATSSLIISIMKFNEVNFTFKNNLKSLIFFLIAIVFCGLYLWTKKNNETEE